MKRCKVMLLGDSISLGYRDIVKNRLRECCNVIYPKEQGKFAADIFRMLYEWSETLAPDHDIDLVYWNAGLWDVVRIYGDEPQTNLEDYGRYLIRITNRLRYLFPNALICFATTTPVLEKRYTEKFYRNNTEIENYNKEAYKVLQRTVDVIDDLYSLLQGIEDSAYVDATHFANQKNHVIAEHICEIIKTSLHEKINEYLKQLLIYYEKKNAMLSGVKNGRIIPVTAVWGAGNIFYMYKQFLLKYCDIQYVCDKDIRMQGSSIGNLPCVSPDEILPKVSLVVVTIDDLEAKTQIEEYCIDNDIVCCSYGEILEVIWPLYEAEKLESMNYIPVDRVPDARDDMVKYIGISIPENTCNLDCTYCYLSRISNRRYKNIRNKNPHIPRYIRMCLNREVIGGVCLIGLTASGETMLTDKLIDVCVELLKEGHYLHIVTNGTITKNIKELINAAGQYAGHIIFKLSFHYLQLLENKQLNLFVRNVKIIEDSDASYTIELMPHDELIPYIPDVLSFSKKHFGAYPQLTIGRNDMDKARLLTKQSFKEYKNTWGVFESEMFDTRMELYMTRGRNCKAGRLSFVFDLFSGRVSRCVFNENIGNIYLDDYKKLDLKEVGDTCPLNYCFNSHVYAPFGILCEEDVDTYGYIRDRIKVDGTHWIKDDMRRFLDTVLK